MDLKKVKNILKCDRSEAIVLFLGRRKSNRVCKNPLDKLKPFYYGYKGCADILMQYVKAPLDASICVTDDFGLQMIKPLQDKGYKNFTLMVTDDDPELAERFVCYIKRYYFKGELNNIAIKRIEECKGMKFNLIISNPPYQVGNEITRNIIENVDFDEFINLMPLSKYKKNNLYKYVDFKYRDITWWDQGGNTFSENDAATIPALCSIKKVPTLNLDYFTFELNYIYDQKFKRYWDEQLKRTPSYSRHIYICGESDYPNINSKTDWCCGIYTPAVLQKNGVAQLEGNKTSLETFMKDPYANSRYRYYAWNFLKPDIEVQDCFKPVHGGKSVAQTITKFNSELEKDNFLKWWHSAELSGKYCKSGLSNILLRAMNKSTDCPFGFIIPRVDWTREWTDEEILRDYGYSNEEIEEILHYNADLIPKNWKRRD